jgi:mannitol-1-phosphate 5-dehydrogenase
MEHVLCGFGFGPIQSGLFVDEAYASGKFSRIVISEVDPTVVKAVRDNGGTYFVNVAKSDGIEVREVKGVEIFNPTVDSDRTELIEALKTATEIVTSLPSVSFYDMGQNSVAKLIIEGLSRSTAAGTLIYTAENNNHAAEIFEKTITDITPLPADKKVQYLNTVIGKMSRVVTDAKEIEEMNLAPIADGLKRAFLVEEFNKILVTKCRLENFEPGIGVFLEKEDLLPFEEAKLYGHNAIHATLAYLGACKGYEKMTNLKNDAALMEIAHAAFLDESGGALTKKYASLGDELFTTEGYKDYAEDLLERMTNPYLEDTIARAGRDLRRKLGWGDRIFGTIVLALEYGIEPSNMAIGAAAGLVQLWQNQEDEELAELKKCNQIHEKIEKTLRFLWAGQGESYIRQITELIVEGFPKLAKKADITV